MKKGLPSSNLNPCKEKKLTKIGAAGKDDNVLLTPVKRMTLELGISFIPEDKLLEVIAPTLRMRKATLSSRKRRSTIRTHRKQAA